MPKFEKIISELEQTVQNLEDSQLDLDKAIALYHKGVKLVGQAKSELTGNEKKVKQLLEQQGKISEEAFDEHEHDN